MSTVPCHIVPISTPLPPQLCTGLRLLLKAWDYAEQCGRDPWDFAVEIAELFGAGLTTTDLRFLSYQGQVEHAFEETKPGAKQRLFSTPGGVLFSTRSCFVLTEAGADVARILEPEPEAGVVEIPFYDRDLRELCFGKLLIKRFRQPAPDQEVILNTFEEEQWALRIDSPLSPHNYDEDPKLRLRRVIRRLNLHQVHRLIYFGSDGIRWEALGGEAPERRC